MIIQCEQCATKFRLDDAKVTAKGVKVRCAKCKHVFTVKQEPSETEAQPDFGTILDQSVEFGREDADASFAPRHELLPHESEDPFGSSLASREETPDQSGDQNTMAFTAPQEESSFALTGDDDFTFSSPKEDKGPVADHDETALPGGNADIAGFDFQDNAPFEETVVAPPSGETFEPVKDGLPEDDFARFMGTAGNTTFAEEAVTGADTTILASLSELPSEELPPLSIASRRRHSPLFTGLVTVLAIAIVALLGYVGYSMFFTDKAQPAKENGRITVRAINASFIRNSVIGDILVISGEAVNEFSKPRAAIQVKGIVYGANGQVLVSKNAYAGNPLTKEQLATLPQEKIEAAMANQFGDSLANLEVVPGKTIPFVIVITKLPADAKDYGVEPVGSTVATGKQQ